jgi:hypothetical protein
MVSSENSKPVSTKRIVMDVSRDGWTKGIQLGISELDEEGGGHGFRIAGPKYNGSQELLLEVELEQRDADEIRSYLDAKFPSADLTALRAGLEAIRSLHLCVDSGPESDGYCNQCSDGWPCRTILALDSIETGGTR